MGDRDSSFTVEEIRQRLSISTLVFHGYRPIGEAALAELARHGIVRIELIESPEQYDLAEPRSMQLIGETCKKCGIQISAYHAYMTSFADVDTEAKRQERVDLCRRQIDTLLELGGKLWGSHAGAADDIIEKSYQELARHIEGTDAIITVENFGREGVTVEDRVAFLDRLDHPQVGMILDIGHERTAEGVNPMTLPGEPTAILEQCGHRLRHLHLHGFKEGRDHHPPLVDGDEIQWRELFEMVRAINYPGDFNFEPRGMLTSPETLDYVERVPEKLVDLLSS